MTEYVQQHYRSAEEKYVHYNFHRRANLAAADEALRWSQAPQVLVLLGQTGSGRRFLLESAVWKAQRDGAQVDYLPLDLTGFTDGPEAILKFVEFQADRFARRGRPVMAEALSWLKEHASLIADDLPGAATVATLLSIGSSIRRWREIEASLLGPRRPSLEALELLLRDLTQAGRLVLHITDSALLHAPLRSWLLIEVRHNPRLILAFSCQPGESTATVVPGMEPLRLEFAPLERRELCEVIDGLFSPHYFPAALVDALWDYSQGWPEQAALKMKDLVTAELVIWARGAWALGEEGVADPAFVRQFTSLLYGVRELRSHSGPLDRFLDLAALCGEFVPADLIIAHLELTGESRNGLLDLIDNELAAEEGEFRLFHDYQFAHPSFPKMLTYGFADSLYGRILVEEIAESVRPQLAAGFLAFLRRNMQTSTRGLARLCLFLSEHLETQEEEEEIRRELAWWVGLEEAEVLAEVIAGDLREGRVSARALLDLVQRSYYQWLPHRRWAVLEALARPGAELSLAEAANLHTLRSGVLREFGLAHESVEEGQAALLVAKSLGPGSEFTLANAHNTLGLTHDLLGQHEAARSHFEAALSALRLERSLPDSHLYASTLSYLGTVLRHQGDLPAARASLEKALEILGHRDPGAGSILSNLGNVLEEQGDLPLARAYLEEALESVRSFLVHGHPGVAAVLSNLGGVLLEQGDLPAARAYLEEAVEIERSIHDRRHPGSAVTLLRLFRVLLEQGDVPAERSVLEKILELLRGTDFEGSQEVETLLQRLQKLRELGGSG